MIPRGKLLFAIVFLFLSWSLLSVNSQSVAETSPSTEINTNIEAQPQPATQTAEPDQAAFDDYAAKAEELYVSALTDYYTGHPDRLSSDLSELTSPEYKSIPAALLDSFHVDRAAIKSAIESNDEHLIGRGHPAADDEQELADDDQEISQRGGGSGIDPSARRGRLGGRRRPRRCYYVLVGSSGGAGGGGGLRRGRGTGRMRRRLRCPAGVVVSGGRDGMEEDDDMADGDGDGGILWIRLRRMRRLMRMMEGRGRGRDGGSGVGGGGGRGRGRTRGRGRGRRGGGRRGGRRGRGRRGGGRGRGRRGGRRL